MHTCVCIRELTSAAVPMRVHYTMIKVLSENIRDHMDSMLVRCDTLDLLRKDDVKARKRADLQEKYDVLAQSYQDVLPY